MSSPAAYVNHPPLARWLDRLFRTAAYLSIASLAPLSASRAGGAWPVEALGLLSLWMLAVGASVCAVATWKRLPQVEWVACYPVIGSLSVHLVQHWGLVGVDRYSVVVAAFGLFACARVNYLASLRAQALRLKDVIV